MLAVSFHKYCNLMSDCSTLKRDVDGNLIPFANPVSQYTLFAGDFGSTNFMVDCHFQPSGVILEAIVSSILPAGRD